MQRPVEEHPLIQSSDRSEDPTSVALIILGVLGTIVAWALVNPISLVMNLAKDDVRVSPANTLLVTPWVAASRTSR